MRRYARLCHAVNAYWTASARGCSAALLSNSLAACVVCLDAYDAGYTVCWLRVLGWRDRGRRMTWPGVGLQVEASVTFPTCSPAGWFLSARVDGCTCVTLAEFRYHRLPVYIVWLLKLRYSGTSTQYRVITHNMLHIPSTRARPQHWRRDGQDGRRG